MTESNSKPRCYNRTDYGSPSPARGQRWNEWEHAGRDNKFPDGVRSLDRVEVRYRDGETETCPARCFLWIQFGEDEDVVAWRWAE